jgi:RHS repeat-associated protein
LGNNEEYIFNSDTLLATIDQQFRNGSATGTAQTLYVHPDHLGSTNVVTNASGTAVVQTLDYYPYGGTRISSGQNAEKRQFIGQFTDSSALSYLNARYYESSRGQFLSEDPTFWSTKQNLANPQSLNSYAYADDNPINKKDPDGLAAYIWANGAGMTGIDTWNKGTYYQNNDAALLSMNAAYAQNNILGGSLGGYQQFKNLVQKGGPWDYLSKANSTKGERAFYFIGNQLGSVLTQFTE